MKKTHKIIMLPTEDLSMLAEWNNKLSFDHTYIDPDIMNNQHLYILSDDEIKEGDWFMSAFYSYPIHNTKEWREKQESMVKESSDCSDLKYHKIIATTDLSLGTKNPNGSKCTIPVPEIPQSLIEYYAKHQPEEVELEYEFPAGRELGEVKLKLQNNEVVWVEPEIEKFKNAYKKANNLYTREEVEEEKIKAIKSFAEMNPLLRGCQITDFEVEQWLKENL